MFSFSCSRMPLTFWAAFTVRLIISQLSSSRDLTGSSRKQAETRLDLDNSILPHLDFFVKLGSVGLRMAIIIDIDLRPKPRPQRTFMLGIGVSPLPGSCLPRP